MVTTVFNRKKPNELPQKREETPQPIPQTPPPPPPKMPFGIDGFKKKLCEDLYFEIKEDTTSVEYYQKIFKTVQNYLNENKSESDYANISNEIKLFSKKYVQNLMKKENVSPKKELDVLIDEVRQNMLTDFLCMKKPNSDMVEVENTIEESFQNAIKNNLTRQTKKSWFERIFKNGKER